MSTPPVPSLRKLDAVAALVSNVVSSGVSLAYHQVEMIISGPIEEFFKKPTEKPSEVGDGILFHLRRDLILVYGPEDERGGVVSHVMLAMMGVLAGVDYLSQVYSKHTTSRKRFTNMLKDLCSIRADAAEAVYQLRCALAHSVALSTTSESYRKGTLFSFEISDDMSDCVIHKVADYGFEVLYRVSFWGLKKIFLEAVSRLENSARDLSHPMNAHVIKAIGRMHSEKVSRT
jgi:hypothetical protein